MMEATGFDIFMTGLFLVIWTAMLVKGEWFLDLSLRFRLILALGYATLFAGWIVSKHV